MYFLTNRLCRLGARKLREFGEENKTSPATKGVLPLGEEKKKRKEKDSDMEIVKGQLGVLLEVVGKLPG